MENLPNGSIVHLNFPFYFHKFNQRSNWFEESKKMNFQISQNTNNFSKFKEKL